MSSVSMNFELESGLAVAGVLVPDMDSGRSLPEAPRTRVVLEAKVFAPEYDVLSAALKLYRGESTQRMDRPMDFLGGDCWRVEFYISDPEDYFYQIEARVVHSAKWRHSLKKELEVARIASSERHRKGLEAERIQGGETLMIGPDLIKVLVGRVSKLTELHANNYATTWPAPHAISGGLVNESSNKTLSRYLHAGSANAAGGEGRRTVGWL